jgi:hypothetical protein
MLFQIIIESLMLVIGYMAVAPLIAAEPALLGPLSGCLSLFWANTAGALALWSALDLVCLHRLWCRLQIGLSE